MKKHCHLLPITQTSPKDLSHATFKITSTPPKPKAKKYATIVQVPKSRDMSAHNPKEEM